MKEYTIKFTKADGTSEERKFTLITASTVRARSLVMRFFKIDKEKVEFNNQALQSLYEDEAVCNDLMGRILVGNHEGVNWFDADMQQVDGVMTDFFTSFQEKMST